MARTSGRLRVDEDGRLEIVDPGLDVLTLLREFDPGFEVRQSPLWGFTSPRFLGARRRGVSLSYNGLRGASESELWRVHKGINENPLTDPPLLERAADEASVLDLKRELALRVLSNCRLCAHRCGVDRTRGDLGICRLGTSAMVAEHFVHIAEEAPINPSLVLNLAGCGMRCLYCQQGALLDPVAVVGQELAAPLWGILDSEAARSVSFVGGNPDESLFAILNFLDSAPDDWKLPVVWNCHAYSTDETLALLDGVVDVYVPDFKYGSDACARRWSSAPGYVDSALRSVALMIEQQVPVIIRIPVLPGHVDCCSLPVLELISGLPREKTLLSIRAQYCPDWKITAKDGEMARRVLPVEAVRVRTRAVDEGWQIIPAGS